MKSILFSIALMAGASSVFAQGVRSIPTGTPLPGADINVRATDGKSLTLNSAKTDKGLLVMFSCNTCPYVIKGQERTKQAMTLAQKEGIGMVIVNSNEDQRSGADSYDEMRKYAEVQKYSVPYVLDEGSRLANEFGATRTPEVFLFNKEGKLVYHGAMEDNPSEPARSKTLYLAQAIKEMTAGKPVKLAETKSIGCGIKRVVQ